MKNKLVMKLLVEGKELQMIEANLLPSSNDSINRKIIGLPKIEGRGKNHINPEAIKDVATGYRAFESIRTIAYPNEQVTIEINYI